MEQQTETAGLRLHLQPRHFAFTASPCTEDTHYIEDRTRAHTDVNFSGDNDRISSNKCWPIAL